MITGQGTGTCSYCGKVMAGLHNCKEGSMFTRAQSLGWENSPLTPAKGLPMPRTVEHYQANAIRDQELILEQRDEIGRLKMKINRLQQKSLDGVMP